MYEVLMHKQAHKKLISLPEKQRVHIAEGIRFLSINPDDYRLDTKKLSGRNQYRLRVGNWRVLYERNDYLKIISIEKIGARGDVYK